MSVCEHDRITRIDERKARNNSRIVWKVADEAKITITEVTRKHKTLDTQL